MPRYRQTASGPVPFDLPRHLEPSRRWRSSSAWQRRRRAQIAREPWCAECGHEGSADNPLTADHVVPVAEGGDPFAGALQTLCLRCNSSKGTR